MALSYLNSVKLVKVTKDERGFQRWGDRRSQGANRVFQHHLRRLDPDAVVRAALDVLDETGLDGLTIRAIADRLCVRGPALYWHFRNKQALLDEMAEAMLADRAAELAPPADGRPWWEALAESARWLRRALLSRRDGARVFAGVTLPSEPTFLGMQDAAIGLLHSAGFSWSEAQRGVATLHVYVVGATIEEQSMPPPEVRAEFEGVFPDAARFPSLAAAFRELRWDGDAWFDHGLELILAGLRAACPPAPPAERATGERSEEVVGRR
jgi:TetR/AcrR family transcriptional regulator, tetracycline repressor protein